MQQVARWLVCAWVAVGLAPAQKTEVVLHRFKASLRGSQPAAGLFRDKAGNLYGTTLHGGPANRGLVFKVDADGHERTIYSFQPGADGASPAAGVIRDADGNLYGTTQAGGTANAGTVYKVAPGGQETVLYSFTGSADGGNPRAGVIRDSAGNLYGTTVGGGTAGYGGVYKLNPGGQQTVLYSFTGGADGSQPYGGVIRDSAGNLYGTTVYGGTVGDGVVFRLSPSGQETVLYSFTDRVDGGQPAAALVRDSAGNLYGTTVIGGLDNSGTVFKLSPSGQETVLYSSVYGVQIFAGVVRDSSGNLYGTTANPDEGGYVFKVSPTGQATVLLNFTGDNGGSPNGVILDPAGNLYGTTNEGGDGAGVVYKLDTAGQETLLYNFPFWGNGGDSSQAGVIRDAPGNLYGTTPNGGHANAGVVFKLDPAGQETVLYSFTGGADGGNPYAGVIFDSAGNLYGTTYTGGTSNAGVVFKLDPAGQETVLYNFTGGADGGNPYAGVIFDSAGNLYGTTFDGGAANAGVVFKLDPAGFETVLHSFSGGADGGYPYAGVVLDASNYLYGTTADGGIGYGVVFKVDPAGQETVLYTFKGLNDGHTPLAGVILDAAGNIYGTTPYGGSFEGGTVYRVDTAGREKVLYDFFDGHGSNPYAGLVLDSAGNLYGTTATGGAGGAGVVFKLDPSGRHETLLHQFQGRSDGAFPYGGVILDSAGNIYGTTSQGGADNGGIVFELEP